MSVCIWVCACVSASAQGSQKGALDSLELYYRQPEAVWRGCWKPNSGLPQEQYMPLTNEHLFSPQGLDFSDRTQIYQSLETGDEPDTVVHAWNISTRVVAVGRTFQGQPGLCETPFPHLPSHKQDESTASLGPVGGQWALTDWQTSRQRKWSHCCLPPVSSSSLPRSAFCPYSVPHPESQTGNEYTVFLPCQSVHPLQPRVTFATCKPVHCSPRLHFPQEFHAFI